MARLRVLDGVYKYVIENDPETAISKNTLKRLILVGKIPSFQNGKKRLIDLDSIDEFLSNITENMENNEL